MICTVIRKEILANLRSLRFALALLLAILLFATSGFVYVRRYEQQVQDYWKLTNDNLSRLEESAKELYKLAFCRQEFWRKPKPLTLCAEGYERSLPNLVIAPSVFLARLPVVGGRHNFLLRRFNDIDWVFIISIPWSVIALLFTYDSFSGEKETGTLRLALSGPVPRHQLLIGKYLGALAALAIPLLAGLLVNLLVVVSSRAVDITGTDWLRVLGVMILSMLYLSLFLLLGMLVSSRASHSISSIVVLLLVWASLVILIPSFGSVVAETRVSVPVAAEFRRRWMDAMQQAERDAQAGKYGRNAHEVWCEDPNSPLVNPPAAARYLNTRADMLDRVWTEQHDHMLAQAYAGRRFAGLSPAVIYARASETIAGTGIRRCADLYRQVKRYHQELKQYVRDQDAADPHSLHLLFDSDWAVSNWGAISKNPADFDAVPKFQEREPPPGEAVRRAAWDISVLGVLNAVLFAAVWISFMRYDVR